MYRAFSDSCHLYIRIVLTLINFECKVLTDRNKRSEMLSLLLWSVNLFIQVYTLIFIKLSWIGFISDKFDTSSSNLISIITSLSFDVLARQNDVNLYNSIDSPRVKLLPVSYKTVACVLQLHYQMTNTICEKSKEAWYYFFNYCPRRDFKSRGGTLETRTYIKESTYSWNIQSHSQYRKNLDLPEQGPRGIDR